MNKFVSLFAATLVLVVIVVGFVFISTQRERESQSRERQQLNNTVNALQLQVAALTASNAAANQFAATAQARAAEFRALAETNAAALAALTNRPAASNAFSLKPYQVRSFVGTQYVGMAWIIPGNQRRDPKTGLVSYDQLVSLPDQSRRTFTAYVTNVVEIPVATEPQLVEQNNYYDQRTYESRPWWYVPPAVVLPPSRPAPPADPATPARLWRPAQPISPPDGILRPPIEGSPGILRPR